MDWILKWKFIKLGFPGWSDGKESTCNMGDLGSSPVFGRSLEEENGYPLQYSCLRNPMDRGALLATVHGVIESQTWLSCICKKQNLHSLVSLRVHKQNKPPEARELWDHRGSRKKERSGWHSNFSWSFSTRILTVSFPLDRTKTSMWSHG